jgi:hypothetical protein
MKKAKNLLLGTMLAALTMVGFEALTPSAANASACGAGEDACSSAESEGYDRFCFNVFKLFKFCYDVTYYHPPEGPPPGN